MTVTVSPADPRSVRALAVLRTADRWTKGHTKAGRPFFAIPGSNGHVYWTDTRACTCPDARERGATCKHQLAVRMWKLEHDAQPAAAPARAGCGVCTQPVPAGVIAELCADCAEAGRMFDGVEAIRAAFGSDAGAVVQMIGPAI